MRAVIAAQAPETRIAAIRELATFGAEAVPAVPLLAELVGHERADVRGAAATALMKLGAHAVAALPTLTALLEGPDVEVRLTARTAFEVVGRHAEPTREVLAAELTAGDPARATMALQQLEDRPEDARALAPQIVAWFDDRNVFTTARAALEVCGPAGVRALLQRLEETDIEPSELDVLLCMVPAGDSAADALLARLAIGRDAQLGRRAAASLAERYGHRPELADAVAAVLRTASTNARLNALYHLPRDAARLEPLLAELLALFGPSHTTATVVGLLAESRVAPDAVVPELERLCRSARPDRRLTGVRALARYGALAATAFDTLIALTGDSDAEIACAALEALQQQHPPAARIVPALRRALTHREPRVRLHAGCTASALDLDDAGIALDLVDTLDDPAAEVREAARWFVPLAGSAVERELEHAASHPSPRVREAARQIVATLEAADLRARLVISAVRHGDTAIALVGLAALERQPALDAAARGAVLDALGSEDPLRVAEAAACVARFGEHAEFAVQPLLAAVAMRDDRVRAACLTRLRELWSLSPAAITAEIGGRHALAVLRLLATFDELSEDMLEAAERGAAHHDDRVRRAALALLRRSGAAKTAERAELTAHEREELRTRIDALLPSAAPAEIDALWQAADPALRVHLLRKATLAKGRLGQHGIELAASTLSESSPATAAACATLANGNRQPSYRAVLVEGQVTGTRRVRRRCSVLLRIGHAAGPPPWLLREARRDPIGVIAAEAYERLFAASGAPPELLLDALRSPSATVRRLALETIERTGVPSPAVREALRRHRPDEVVEWSMGRPVSEVSAWASALASAGELDPLAAAIRSGRFTPIGWSNTPTELRRAAAAAFTVLHRFGKRARPLAEEAFTALHVMHPQVVEGALLALAAMDFPSDSPEGRRILEALPRAKDMGYMNVARRVRLAVDRDAERDRECVRYALVARDRELLDDLVALPAERFDAVVLPVLTAGITGGNVFDTMLGELAEALRSTPVSDARAEFETVLRAALASDRRSVWRSAAQCLAALGADVRSILGIARGGAEGRQLAVWDAFGRTQPAGLIAAAGPSEAQHVERIPSDLPDAERRAAAVAAIAHARAARGDERLAWLRAAAHFGDAAEAAVPLVLELLEAEPAPAPGSPVVPVPAPSGQLHYLLARLGSRGVAVLETQHAAGTDVVRPLASALWSARDTTRIAVLRAAHRLRLRDPGLVGAAIAVLRCGDPVAERWAAIYFLDAFSAVPEQRAAVRDLAASADPYVRRRALEALAHAPSPEFEDVGALAEAVLDPEAPVALVAVRGLETFGPDVAGAALPALQDALDHADERVRSAAAQAIRTLRR